MRIYRADEHPLALLAFVRLLGGDRGGRGDLIVEADHDRNVRAFGGIDVHPIQLALRTGGQGHADRLAVHRQELCVRRARTLGPAVVSGTFDDIWVYFVSPVLGGIVAALLYRYLRTNGEAE